MLRCDATQMALEDTFENLALSSNKPEHATVQHRRADLPAILLTCPIESARLKQRLFSSTL